MTSPPFSAAGVTSTRGRAHDERCHRQIGERFRYGGGAVTAAAAARARAMSPARGAQYPARAHLHPVALHTTLIRRNRPSIGLLPRRSQEGSRHRPTDDAPERCVEIVVVTGSAPVPYASDSSTSDGRKADRGLPAGRADRRSRPPCRCRSPCGSNRRGSSPSPRAAGPVSLIRISVCASRSVPDAATRRMADAVIAPGSTRCRASAADAPPPSRSWVGRNAAAALQLGGRDRRARGDHA